MEWNTLGTPPSLPPLYWRAALKRKMTPSYQGTFTSAQKYILQTFATTHSPLMKKRVSRYMLGGDCKACHGKRLQPASLSVKFAGHDIADLSRLPLIILDSSVGQVRVCIFPVLWLGATTTRTAFR